MKCHFPVAEVDGVTIAILPRKSNGKRLGLLLHPAPNDRTQGPSRQLYYVSWLFGPLTGSADELFRLAVEFYDETGAQVAELSRIVAKRVRSAATRTRTERTGRDDPRSTSSLGPGSNEVSQAVVGSPSSAAEGRCAGRTPASVSSVAREELAVTALTPSSAPTAIRSPKAHGR